MLLQKPFSKRLLVDFLSQLVPNLPLISGQIKTFNTSSLTLLFHYFFITCLGLSTYSSVGSIELYSQPTVSYVRS